MDLHAEPLLGAATWTPTRWSSSAGGSTMPPDRWTAPEAMAVASVGDDGQPSVRMVLLKQWGEDGFVFHSNYDSRKGRELTAHPLAALLFYWEPRGRQVRIEGPVERTSAEESDAYFATRPRGAQIGAHASQQSAVVAGRDGAGRTGPCPRGRVRRPPGAPTGRVGRAAGPSRGPTSSGRTAGTGSTTGSATRRRTRGWTVERLQP